MRLSPNPRILGRNPTAVAIVVDLIPGDAAAVRLPEAREVGGLAGIECAYCAIVACGAGVYTGVIDRVDGGVFEIGAVSGF